MIVQVWCAVCRRYVEFTGLIYESGAKPAVHVTPEMLEAHRAEAHT